MSRSRRSPLFWGQHREAERFARIDIGLRDQARQGADAADIARALGDRDGTARVEQIEAVRRLENHLVTRQRELRFEQPLCFRLEERKLLEELPHARFVERVLRLLDFVLEEDVAIRYSLDVLQIEH